MVTFKPEGNRMSAGETSADGTYELRYIRNVMGAAIGTHQVSLRDNTKANRLPKKYSAVGAVSAEVTRGRNEINFELTADDG